MKFNMFQGRIQKFMGGGLKLFCELKNLGGGIFFTKKL